MIQPKNWLTPQARQELRALVAGCKGTEPGWPEQRELFRAAHEAVPQLLDVLERVQAECESVRDAGAYHGPEVHQLTTQILEMLRAR